MWNLCLKIFIPFFFWQSLASANEFLPIHSSNGILIIPFNSSIPHDDVINIPSTKINGTYEIDVMLNDQLGEGEQTVLVKDSLNTGWLSINGSLIAISPAKSLDSEVIYQYVLVNQIGAESKPASLVIRPNGPPKVENMELPIAFDEWFCIDYRLPNMSCRADSSANVLSDPEGDDYSIVSVKPLNPTEDTDLIINRIYGSNLSYEVISADVASLYGLLKFDSKSLSYFPKPDFYSIDSQCVCDKFEVKVEDEFGNVSTYIASFYSPYKLPNSADLNVEVYSNSTKKVYLTGLDTAFDDSWDIEFYDVSENIEVTLEHELINGVNQYYIEVFAKPEVLNTTEFVEFSLVSPDGIRSPRSKLTVVISPAGITAPPSFSVPSGSYYRDTLVYLKRELADDLIYYTLDGSIPSPANGSLYKGGGIWIMLEGVEDKTIQLNAISMRSGFYPSRVKTAVYTSTLDPALILNDFKSSVNSTARGTEITLSWSTPNQGQTVKVSSVDPLTGQSEEVGRFGQDQTTTGFYASNLGRYYFYASVCDFDGLDCGPTKIVEVTVFESPEDLVPKIENLTIYPVDIVSSETLSASIDQVWNGSRSLSTSNYEFEQGKGIKLEWYSESSNRFELSVSEPNSTFLKPVTLNSQEHHDLEKILVADYIGTKNISLKACNSQLCGAPVNASIIVKPSLSIDLFKQSYDTLSLGANNYLSWKSYPGIQYEATVVTPRGTEYRLGYEVDPFSSATAQIKAIELGNYKLKIRACFNQQCGNTYNSSFNVIANAIPTKIESVEASFQESQNNISILWSPALFASLYRIEVSINYGDWEYIAETPFPFQSFFVEALAGILRFRVQACNEVGDCTVSNLSNELDIGWSARDIVVGQPTFLYGLPARFIQCVSSEDPELSFTPNQISRFYLPTSGPISYWNCKSSSGETEQVYAPLYINKLNSPQELKEL